MRPTGCVAALALSGVVLLGCASPGTKEDGNLWDLPVVPYRVVFSTGVDENLDPLDDLKTISFAQEKVYIQVRWNMPIGEHLYQLRIFDGDGKEALRHTFTFATTSIDWNTFTWYRLNPAVDAPGMWRFVISIDGENRIDTEFPIQR